MSRIPVTGGHGLRVAIPTVGLRSLSVTLARLLRPAVFSLLACLCPAICAAEPSPAPDEEIVRLPEMEVQTTAYCNFGFGIIVFGNNEAGTISRILIDDVLPDTAAAKYGLKSGDEILAVNGKRVAEMKGGMKGGSELFRLLVNRPPGERIDIEVVVRVVKRVSLTAGP